MTLTATHPLTDGSPYQGYAYGYPHKTAYRTLAEPVYLHDLWAAEPRSALQLYLHVPFCEMRCGFCNLFTQARPREGVVATYLDALARQVDQVREALGSVSFARLAIGGGTPTALDLPGLERLFDLAGRLLGAGVTVPASIETSPETATPDKLALVRERGVRRVSIGVQSFVEAETTAVGRPQRRAAVQDALEVIRAGGFPVLNIDLIYGLPGQTVTSWLASVRAALEYRPEELYLYPLYVRPGTGLGGSRRTWDDQRLACYRVGADLLQTAGYRQVSMRMFQAAHAPDDEGPEYCCQGDGMVGLGCGARSYTSALHFADEYAVRPEGVRAVLGDYVARPAAAFAVASHGFRLNGDEQRRRFVLLSLLQCEGLDLDAYGKQFGGDALGEVAQLDDLESLGLASRHASRLVLTPSGLERSDAIGPWLYSPAVRERMEEYTWR